MKNAEWEKSKYLFVCWREILFCECEIECVLVCACVYYLLFLKTRERVWKERVCKSLSMEEDVRVFVNERGRECVCVRERERARLSNVY